MAKAKKYSGKSIKVLGGLEGIRQNPSMYIGSTDVQGVNQVVKEAVDNAIDEYFNQKNKTLRLHYDAKEHCITVADTGRGIPVERHAKTKSSTLTSVLTMLHSGGKFHGKGKTAYSVSSGLHGVGIKAANALSSIFEVWTYRDKQWWYQKFVQGIPKGKDKPGSSVKWPLKVKSSKLPFKHKKGTIVRMVPDPQIFKKSKFDFNSFVEWFEDLQYLLPGLNISISDGKKTKTFLSEEGLSHFVKVLAKKNKSQPLVTHRKEPVVFKYHNEAVDVALFFGDDDEERLLGYANSIQNSEGGYHIASLQNLLSSILLEGTKKKDVIKADLRAGVIGALHIKLANPQYGGQTKQKLVTKEAEVLVKEALLEPLTRFLRKHPKLVSTLVQRAVELKKARDSFNKDKAALKNIKISKGNARGLLPGKLAAAPRCKPEDRELFLVEGDSAAGSAIMARDSSFQEILPLKGKIINAAKATTHKLFANEEIKAIVAAIGCDIKNAQPEKARVGKVMLFCISGNTKIPTLNGKLQSVKKLYKTHKKGGFYVYAIDPKTGNPIPAKVNKVAKTKKTKKVAIITLSNGKKIKCTVDHKFMVNPANEKDKSLIWKKGLPFKKAEDLLKGESLKTIYTKVTHDGYETIKCGALKSSVHKWVISSLKKKSFKKLLANSKGIGNYEYALHHKDRNKRNNEPSNLEVITKAQHAKERGLTVENGKELVAWSETKKRKYPTQATTKFVSFCEYLHGRNIPLNKNNYDELRIKRIRLGNLAQGTPKWDFGVNATGLEYASSKKLTSFVNHYNMSVKAVRIVTLQEPIQMYCLNVEATGNFCIDGGVKRAKYDINQSSAKICISNSDEDSDGLHIESLILAFLSKYYPELIKAGMVYAVNAPLFKISHKGKNHYGDNLEDLLKKFPSKSKPIVSRFKGLGECNPEELEEFGLNVKTRRLTQLKYNKKQPGKVEQIMGSDSAFRKLILNIEKHEK